MSNYYGCWSLFAKETRRFLKVYNQTLIAPAINALLLLAIFSLSIGERVHEIGGISFQKFMSAGLIIMVAMQNAFANTSSSMIMGKVLAHIIDYLMPPISSGGIVFAMVVSAVLRGILVGILLAILILFFVPIEVYNFAIAAFYMFSAVLFLALFGMFSGIVSESFDQQSAITSYLITPLTFLSGTFYSINNLPPFWHKVSQYNPFFYMIDGFRYGLTGHHDGSLTIGAIYVLAINIALWAVVHIMMKCGYKIKS